MDYTVWENHFGTNYGHLDHISFDGDELTLAEKELITTSIQQFQRGENSEGKNLIHFARNSEFRRYHETIIHFIKEEQRHALILGKWMDNHDINRIQDHWVDNVFRKMRRFSNLENSIRILLTAEIIAAVYYKALRDATRSKTLQAICKQILIDEAIHLDFQCYTLSHFQRKRGGFLRIVHNFKQRILMTGTILVVWKEHRKVLTAGGYSFMQFAAENFEIMERCLNQIIALREINLPKGALRFQEP
jgi:hypothetical protein